MTKKRLANRSLTSRGFHVYDEFHDDYGKEVKVYESSAASSPHVWVSVQQAGDPDDYAAAHLSVVQAIALRDALDVFLQEIPERWEDGTSLYQDALEAGQ